MKMKTTYQNEKKKKDSHRKKKRRKKERKKHKIMNLPTMNTSYERYLNFKHDTLPKEAYTYPRSKFRAIPWMLRSFSHSVCHGVELWAFVCRTKLHGHRLLPPT